MNLSFSHVTVDYPATDGTLLRALDDFSLDVAEGEPVAIIGPSGCGKSTLLRLTAGLMSPTSGQVMADGAELREPRKATAYILQDFGLLPWKNVYANAELGLRIHKVAEPERGERTRAALEAVGLSGFEHSFPNQLSGGMQQRLALARAMALDVDLLLMDEPLSALDALLREELQNTLLNLWQQRGHSQILVTHSIEEAVFLGRRIVVMAPRPGRVVAQISNPEMGSVEYRNDPLFFDRCRQVRAALAEGGER
ncbi:MAG: ABC transporter ATP-binding protein [Coriobacteriia bacterium]|nr:ABC transporter ATP-binding protein [Coriobacteriia bacterium]